MVEFIVTQTNKGFLRLNQGSKKSSQRRVQRMHPHRSESLLPKNVKESPDPCYTDGQDGGMRMVSLASHKCEMPPATNPLIYGTRQAVLE